MLSTFMGIEIGKRALQISQQTMYIIENNISNSENPDYTRQTVDIKSLEPLWIPGISTMERTAGQVGQGAYIAFIDRVKDIFLDDKINNEITSSSYFSQIKNYVEQVETLLAEPDGLTLDVTMREFFDAFNSLAKDPESIEKKVIVKNKAESLVAKFNHLYDGTKALQNEVNTLVSMQVTKANRIIMEISEITIQINKIEATGQQANDMKDRRDKLVADLANYISVTVKQNEGFHLYLGGRILVQNEGYNQLELIPDVNNEGFYSVRLDKQELPIKNGSIQGLIDMRDDVLAGLLANINTLALTTIESINNVHKQGMNAKGTIGQAFFKEIPLTNYTSGDYDINQDGTNDTAVIYKIIGTKKLDPYEKLMTAGQLNINGVQINYSENDTVLDIVKKVNLSNAGVTLFINNQGYLEVKGNVSDNGVYFIKTLGDTGQFLSNVSGVVKDQVTFDAQNRNTYQNLYSLNQIYLLSPEKNIASWINLADEIKTDPSNIATAFPNRDVKEGDGKIALEISQLYSKKFMVIGNQSISDFYSSMVIELASLGKEVDSSKTHHEMVLGNFKNIRASYSGVNMDEELSNMMKFQKAYHAAAKFIEQQDRLYDVLMGILR